MPSSDVLRRVALIRTDVSEERSASIIRVTRLGELIEALCSSETSVPTRDTRRNIPEDGILHSHRLETSNLTYFSSMGKLLVTYDIV
jgi:hypothetical protein